MSGNMAFILLTTIYLTLFAAPTSSLAASTAAIADSTPDPAAGEASASIEVDTTGLRNFAPKLYLDCPWWCDRDFIKSEIDFVNYVRERTEADIHLLVTSEQTAGGGKEYTLQFIGQGEYSDLNFSIHCTTCAGATEDADRRALVEAMKKGLMPFVARTRLADYITIDFQEETSPEDVEDRWNNWVFEIGLSGYANGEKQYRHLWMHGEATIKRITTDRKFVIYSSFNYNEDDYRSDDYSYLSLSRNRGMWLTYARAVGDHFSAGGFLSYHSSTYSNIEHRYAIAPTVELNLFPYAEYADHEFTFMYGISAIHDDYFEETLYGKFQENLFSEELRIALEMTKTWGSVEISLSGSHYFHDFSKNELNLWTDISLRLFAGFSLELGGGASMIHDQLYLPGRGYSAEEISARQRQLETDYSYWTNFGVSYTFGSIYSNVVNPRF